MDELARPRRKGAILAILCLSAAFGSAACSSDREQDPGLLAGLQPWNAVRVTSPSSLTDGDALANGAPWDQQPSARFRGTRSKVEYDLGASKRIGAIWILADHNDEYEISVSQDGGRFTPIWLAPPVESFGFRARFNGALDAEARFIRLRPIRGDGDYAVSELRVYSEPMAEPPSVPRVAGYAPGRTFRSKVLLFGLGLVAWLVLAFRRSPWWWVLLSSAWPIVAGYQLLDCFFTVAPVGSREVSLVRGTVAVVAAVAIGLEVFARRLRPKPWVELTVLAVCALTAFLAFYNLGQPQFRNLKTGQDDFAHYFDLRQYYTTAKYFEEVGYGGIYAADMAAYLEDVPGASMERLANTAIRDLESLQVLTVSQQRDAIAAAPARFSPERWAEYKRDTGYFRQTVGNRAYLDTLLDMGGNATPVWLSVTHLVFNAVDPSDAAFAWMALLDPLLILAALIAIGFTFGVRTMLVCMVIFGANDFIMYGTNWAGATLRHDWMAYLGFGACALQRKRYVWGGAFFAASAMIRAFPALALVGAALPSLWWFLDYRLRQGRFPSLPVIRLEQQALLRIIAGAAIGVAVLFLFSIMVLPADAWLTWIKKVGQLSSGTQHNHVSLRLLIAGWESGYHTMMERVPLFVSAIVAMVALVLAGARRASPVQGAMLGLILIPVVFYPANYYSHYVWLLPMLALERRDADPSLRPADALIWMALLSMCGVQYFTVLANNLSLHFWLGSAVLFATLPTILVLWLSRDRLDRLAR
jgi:hypothetical protein